MNDPKTPLDWQHWMQAFGAQQRRVREFLGLSQQELARRAGVSQGAVSRLETARGVATPMLVAMKISSTLASELRQLDPSILNADLCETLAMTNLLPPARDGRPQTDRPSGAARGVSELVALYQTIPEQNRAGLVSILKAAGTALAAGGAGAAGAARRLPRRRSSSGRGRG
jgi:transcriptional regulator with XRE-family HTH domain